MEMTVPPRCAMALGLHRLRGVRPGLPCRVHRGRPPGAIVKQQLIVSGLGGQGALPLTRLLAEAAMALGLPVITSETHGMAQRGGTVISMVKVGPFRGPLIPAGEADVGLFLDPKNLAVHGFYLKPGAAGFVNCGTPGPSLNLDAPH